MPDYATLLSIDAELNGVSGAQFDPFLELGATPIDTDGALMAADYTFLPPAPSAGYTELAGRRNFVAVLQTAAGTEAQDVAAWTYFLPLTPKPHPVPPAFLAAMVGALDAGAAVILVAETQHAISEARAVILQCCGAAGNA
jgi:hypothetical protein